MTTENKLRRWLLWGSLIALGVVIFGIFVFTRVDIVWNTIINRTDQPLSVATNYFEAIRNQDYAAAYGDLDSQATLNGQVLDEQSFIKLAQAADAGHGPLLTYGFLRLPGDGAQFNASLRRGDQSYTVHLQLKQAGNRWTIVSADGL